MALLLRHVSPATFDKFVYSAGSKPDKIWSRSTQRITADFR